MRLSLHSETLIKFNVLPCFLCWNPNIYCRGLIVEIFIYWRGALYLIQTWIPSFCSNNLFVVHSLISNCVVPVYRTQSCALQMINLSPVEELGKMARYARHRRKENRGNLPGSNLRVECWVGQEIKEACPAGCSKEREREGRRERGREDPLRRVVEWMVVEWWRGFLRSDDPLFHYINYNGGKRTKRRIIEIQLLKRLSSSRLVERAINLALTPLTTNIFPCYPTFATHP